MSEQQTRRPEKPLSEATSATATETTQQVAPETSAKAQEIGERLQNEAQRLTEEAKEKGQSMLQDQQHAIADQVGGLATALRSTSEQLKTQDQVNIAQYTQQAADGLDRFSRTLKERDLSTLVGQVEDFARNQPGAFIGGAAFLGFMAARFLKSSAERRAPSSSDMTTHYPQAQPSYMAGRPNATSQSGRTTPSTVTGTTTRSAVSPGAETGIPTSTPPTPTNPPPTPITKGAN